MHAATPGESAQLDAAVAALAGRSIAALTGAGISTDSGIPDYRGEGAPPRNPMSFDEFLTDERYRARYWAGSHLGWRRFSTVEPNAGHLALARMERAGLVTGVITQNVDGLHRRAGSRRVIDLHGTMARVRCLACGTVFPREEIAERLAAANPWLDEPDEVRLSPDGDVEVASVERFIVPECSVCGGMLKPDVVYFGELVPVDLFDEAAALVAESEALLVAGSSLVVNTGIRLLERARRDRKPVVIINRGATRWDARADVKLDAGTSEMLVALAERLA
jgi:NAD-dependent SIR2 family protein deacetylase